MSAIVTPQGIAAQKKWEADVIALYPIIYSRLADKAENPGDLIPQIAALGYEQSAARESMWRLLDKRLIRLEVNRNLVALHVKDWGESGTFDYEWGAGCVECNAEWPCPALQKAGVTT